MLYEVITDSQLEEIKKEKTELDNKLKDFKTEDEKPLEDKNRLEELENKLSTSYNFV